MPSTPATRLATASGGRSPTPPSWVARLRARLRARSRRPPPRCAAAPARPGWPGRPARRSPPWSRTSSRAGRPARRLTARRRPTTWPGGPAREAAVVVDGYALGGFADAVAGAGHGVEQRHRRRSPACPPARTSSRWPQPWAGRLVRGRLALVARLRALARVVALCARAVPHGRGARWLASFARCSPDRAAAARPAADDLLEPAGARPTPSRSRRCWRPARRWPGGGARSSASRRPDPDAGRLATLLGRGRRLAGRARVPGRARDRAGSACWRCCTRRCVDEAALGAGRGPAAGPAGCWSPPTWTACWPGRPALPAGAARAARPADRAAAGVADRHRAAPGRARPPGAPPPPAAGLRPARRRHGGRAARRRRAGASTWPCSCRGRAATSTASRARCSGCCRSCGPIPRLRVVVWQGADFPDQPFDDGVAAAARARAGRRLPRCRRRGRAGAGAGRGGPAPVPAGAGRRPDRARAQLRRLDRGRRAAARPGRRPGRARRQRRRLPAARGRSARPRPARPQVFSMTALDDPIQLAQGYGVADAAARWRAMSPRLLDPVAPARSASAGTLVAGRAERHRSRGRPRPAARRRPAGHRPFRRQLPAGLAGTAACSSRAARPGGTCWPPWTPVGSQVLEPQRWRTPPGARPAVRLGLAGPGLVPPRYVVDRSPWSDPAYRAPLVGVR